MAGRFGKLLQYAVLHLLLFLSLLTASQHTCLFGLKFVFSRLGTELPLQLRSLEENYCFQMYFYYGKHSEQTT